MTRKFRLVGSLFTMVVLVGAVLGASSAFFSDTESSSGNVMQAGGFDLLLNGQNNPEALVYVTDLKPGDTFIATKSAMIATNPGRVWMHIKDLEASQSAQTEPEIIEELRDGEKWDIHNYIDYDLKVDGTEIITLDDEVRLPDAVSCWIPLGTFPGNEVVNIEQSFHFDPTVTDWAQGDSLTFTEEFWAIQDRNNDQGPPERDRVWNAETKRCEDVGDSLLWIIGDEEASQTDNPVDELNYVAFGNFPTPPAIGDPYTRVITAPVDDAADEEFPWNSNYNADYGRVINVEFNYSGAIPQDVRLSVGWSPGRSANEQKQVFLDGSSLGTTLLLLGVDTPGWWSNMPRYVHTFDFQLTSTGLHTISLHHLQGDGTLWDFVKLEKI